MKPDLISIYSTIIMLIGITAVETTFISSTFLGLPESLYLKKSIISPF